MFSFSQLFISIMISFSLLLIVFLVFFKIEKVSGSGMEPNFFGNDIVLIKKQHAGLKRFDTVSCNVGGKQMLLRVIGLPDEMVYYRDDILYINNNIFDEDFIGKEINKAHLEESFYTESFQMNSLSETGVITKDHYLLLCDNRPYGNDSRLWGLVPEKDIQGVVAMKVSSVNE